MLDELFENPGRNIKVLREVLMNIGRIIRMLERREKQIKNELEDAITMACKDIGDRYPL